MLLFVSDCYTVFSSPGGESQRVKSLRDPNQKMRGRERERKG